MNCQQVQESLGDHSVGLLTTSALSAFQQHVAVCAECARSVRQFERCMDLLSRTPSPAPPSDLWVGVRARLDLERSIASYAQDFPQVPPAKASWWSGAVATVAGFGAAMAIMISLAGQNTPSNTAVAGVPPVVVSVSRHNAMDASVPIADGASVIAIDAVTSRPMPGHPSHARTILPGREIFGEPIAPGIVGQ